MADMPVLYHKHSDCTDVADFGEGRCLVGGHLTATRRDAFTRAGGQPIRELPHLKHGQRVKIGGLIVARHERGALVRPQQRVFVFWQSKIPTAW